MILAVVFALATACSNAVNLMTQHSASVSAPKREKGWRLAVYLVRQPPWLLGAAAAVSVVVLTRTAPKDLAPSTPAGPWRPRSPRVRAKHT